MTTAHCSGGPTPRRRPRLRSAPAGTGCSSAWRRSPSRPPTTTTPPGAGSGAWERRPASLLRRPTAPADRTRGRPERRPPPPTSMTGRRLLDGPPPDSCGRSTGHDGCGGHPMIRSAPRVSPGCRRRRSWSWRRCPPGGRGRGRSAATSAVCSRRWWSWRSGPLLLSSVPVVGVAGGAAVGVVVVGAPPRTVLGRRHFG